MSTPLHWTAKDAFRLSPKDWLHFNSVVAFYKITGLWRYPVPASGDFETMKKRDMIYWLYKSQYPVKHAWKGAGLEDFFAKHAQHSCTLPKGFQSQSELTLSATGDLMDHPFLPNSYGALYEKVEDTVFDADVSMSNLECVVFPNHSEALVFNTTEAPGLYYKLENFKAAKGVGSSQYTFLTTANNHSLDYGIEGVQSTIRSVKEAGISHNGMNETEADAGRATIVEKKGFKLGLIGHTFGLNAKKPPKDKPWIVNRTHFLKSVSEIDFTQIEKQIRFCRENDVDVVIAQLHWGMEHEYYPRPNQIDIAHHLAEMGVDILIGHHPHVTQPVEFYTTKRDPDRCVPIFYSIGNLLTPFLHPAFRRSHVVRLTLGRGMSRDGQTRTYVSSAKTVEVVMEVDQQNQKLRLMKGSA